MPGGHGILDYMYLCCDAECLRELNDHVDGSYVDESPGNVIVNNPSFFDDYSIIIGTQLSEQDSIALDAICRQSNIPVVYARTYGLSGMLRVSGISYVSSLGASNYCKTVYWV